MVVVYPTLADAARDQRVSLVRAGLEYDRALYKATVARLNAERAANAAWHAARGRALQSAAARQELWRGHHAMTTDALLIELRRHRFHLSEYAAPCRDLRLVTTHTWYVRMITTELRRRSVKEMT